MKARASKIGTVIILTAATLTFCAVKMVGSSEPSYAGKSLSQWIRFHDDGEPTIATEQVSAIRAIGTNAVPCLVEWIRYSQTPLKRKAYVAANGCLARLGIHAHLADHAFSRAEAAAFALVTLGEEARPAVPVLRSIYQDPHTPPPVRFRVGVILRSLERQ